MCVQSPLSSKHLKKMSDYLSTKRRQPPLVVSDTLDLDGVIVEILSWLPAKSLLRFRCVCKPWRALISEPYFIRKHLTRSKIRSSFKLLVKQPSVFRSIEYHALLNCLSDAATVPSSEHDFPVINLPQFKFQHFRVFGACNGLICLALDYETATLMIWNPCTGESQVLPQPPIVHEHLHYFEHLRYFGFGYDSTSNDYKVILGGWVRWIDEFVVVFSLKTGSWRKVELTKYFRVTSMGYLVNEALHWVLREQYEPLNLCPSRIVAFDLGEERFHEIAFPYLPNSIDRSTLFAQVGTLGSCLTLNFQTKFQRPGCDLKMWVMKEYGLKKSWIEIIYIPPGILRETYFCRTCISENGELLISMDLNGPLAIYNPKEKTFRFLLEMKLGSLYKTATYVETLVSPLIGSTIGASV